MPSMQSRKISQLNEGRLPCFTKTFYVNTDCTLVRRWEILTMKLAALIFLVLVALPLAVHGADGSDSLPVVQASEILAKIQKGEPVEYDHVVVKSDLDLSQLQLQTNVTSPIRISDSIFDGFVSFNHTNLDNSIDMSGSNFTKDANFNYATFSSYTDFSRATFSGDASFYGATFIKKHNFIMQNSIQLYLVILNLMMHFLMEQFFEANYL
jgi:hypothetical protein